MPLDIGQLLQGGLSIFGASQGADAARQAARAGTPMPFGTSGPAGGTFVDPRTGQIQFGMADNPFGTMFNALGMQSLANVGTAPGSPLFGASPEIAQAFQGLFGQGLTENAQTQLGLLRDLAAPEEARMREGLDTQLFARGQLGTTGGAERFRALEEAMEQADLQRQLQSFDLARREGLDRFTGALQGTGAGMASQAQQFGIGQGAFGGLNQLLDNLFRQGSLGIGAMTGVPPQLAALQAQASQGPLQAGMSFLQNSGAFDALGNLFSGGRASLSQIPFPRPGLLLDTDLGSMGITGNFGL